MAAAVAIIDSGGAHIASHLFAVERLGVTGQDLEKVLGGNWLRLLEDSPPASVQRFSGRGVD